MSSGSIFAFGRGLFAWQHTPNQEDEPSLLNAHRPKSKESEEAWFSPSWLIVQDRFNSSEELQEVYLFGYIQLLSTNFDVIITFPVP